MVWFHVGRLITVSSLKKKKLLSVQQMQCCWAGTRWQEVQQSPFSQIMKYLLKSILWQPTKIFVSFKLFSKIFWFVYLLCMSKDVFVFVLFLLPPPLLQKAIKFLVLVCLNNTTSNDKRQWKYIPLASLYSRYTHRILWMLKTTSSSSSALSVTHSWHTYSVVPQLLRDQH